MGWSEVVYFNVFYAVVAVLIVVGLVSLLHWLGTGIEQFGAWALRLLSPKPLANIGGDVPELAQIKAELARNGVQAAGRQGSYQTRLARLSLENCRFRKDVQQKTDKLQNLLKETDALEKRVAELRATVQPLKAEADKKEARIASLEDQLSAREMELDVLAEAYQALIESHDGELKRLVALLQNKQLDEVTLKHGRTYLKRDIKTMRKLLIDLETTAAAVISMPVAFVRVASARPNGRANGHAGDELTH